MTQSNQRRNSFRLGWPSVLLAVAEALVGVGGVQGVYGEGISVHLKEILANHQGSRTTDPDWGYCQSVERALWKTPNPSSSLNFCQAFQLCLQCLLSFCLIFGGLNACLILDLWLPLLIVSHFNSVLLLKPLNWTCFALVFLFTWTRQYEFAIMDPADTISDKL